MNDALVVMLANRLEALTAAMEKQAAAINALAASNEAIVNTLVELAGEEEDELAMDLQGPTTLDDPDPEEEPEVL